MKFLALLAVILFSVGCGAIKHRVNVYEQVEEIHVNRRAKVPLATVQAVADARGGKEDGEIWYVDAYRGDIRIKKSRNGSKPDDDVELWYKDADGSWSHR